MRMKTKDLALLSYLEKDFSDATTSLHFSSPFECLVAILLSAQTTDKSVNAVTPALFSHFPTPERMAEASVEEIEQDIRRLGLSHAKAKNILTLSQKLVTDFGGEVPLEKKILLSLPGVGNKTAGVFLLEQGIEPYLPVDTHVHRIADRLGYSKEKDDPKKVEEKLEKTFPREKWVFLHHALIWFGRKKCHALKPECEDCPLQGYCSYFKKNSSKIGR